MAKYTPITKTLKKATPTIRSSDNVVKSWNVEVVYSYAGDATADPVLPAWKTSYSETEDVLYLGKTADEYTKSELIGFMNPSIENHIFEAHYESQNMPATEERKQDFDFSALPD
tara:strand:- start:2008 stop:2349 length:342 start_codon:yes stop_codon:yes gene_type:complete